MSITRRQFVAGTTAGLIVPNVRAAANDKSVDRELTGKTVCGYQGWFNARGDGMGLGFRHYDAAGHGFKPGHCTIDLWPDVSELDADERYDTAFRHKNGRVAQVFSSANAKTVRRHHRWMKTYGIDGVALQRFGNALKNDRLRKMRNTVLGHTRKAAAAHGRLWVNMYDLSGMKNGEPQDIVAADWRGLVESQRVTEDHTYLRHHGKPVVAVWGVGFNDGRDYTLEDCAALIDRVSMGGRCSVMLGVPYYWREQERDAIKDPALHDVLRKADILSPWAVGRFGSPKDAIRLGNKVLKPDLAWCKREGKHYLPVAFPGFSWHNLDKSRGRSGELGQVPRRRGEFLWAQAEAARKAGAGSLYVAMFDELDEATAVFKCTNDPPVGDSPFLTYDGLPSDHYLWLTGRLAERLRQGAGPAIGGMPTRE